MLQRAVAHHNNPQLPLPIRDLWGYEIMRLDAEIRQEYFEIMGVASKDDTSARDLILGLVAIDFKGISEKVIDMKTGERLDDLREYVHDMCAEWLR